MRTAFTSVKTVAFNPIPSASARTATAEHQRSLAIRSSAKRRSFSIVIPYGTDAEYVRRAERLTGRRRQAVRQEGRDRRDQLVGVDGLGDVPVEACFERPPAVGGTRVGGQRDRDQLVSLHARVAQRQLQQFV